jgi:hypothetical protein
MDFGFTFGANDQGYLYQFKLSFSVFLPLILCIVYIGLVVTDLGLSKQGCLRTNLFLDTVNDRLGFWGLPNLTGIALHLGLNISDYFPNDTNATNWWLPAFL